MAASVFELAAGSPPEASTASAGVKMTDAHCLVPSARWMPRRRRPSSRGRRRPPSRPGALSCAEVTECARGWSSDIEKELRTKRSVCLSASDAFHASLNGKKMLAEAGTRQAWCQCGDVGGANAVPVSVKILITAPTAKFLCPCPTLIYDATDTISSHCPAPIQSEQLHGKECQQMSIYVTHRIVT
jgi:hypothetical protein